MSENESLHVLFSEELEPVEWSKLSEMVSNKPNGNVRHDESIGHCSEWEQSLHILSSEESESLGLSKAFKNGKQQTEWRYSLCDERKSCQVSVSSFSGHSIHGSSHGSFLTEVT